MAVARGLLVADPLLRRGEALRRDFLVSVALLAVAVEWWRRPDRSGWLWVLAAFGTIGTGIVLPLDVRRGGVGLALLPTVMREGRPAHGSLTRFT